MQPSSIEIKMADGIFVKSMHIQERYTVVPQHAHTYDHISMVATGAVRVWRDGKYFGDFTAPTGIVIKAKTMHRFLSLADDTLIYCIHNVRDAEGVDVHQENELTDEDFAILKELV